MAGVGWWWQETGGVAEYKVGGRQEGLPGQGQLGNWTKPLIEDKILKTFKRHQKGNKRVRHIRAKTRARMKRREVSPALRLALSVGHWPIWKKQL